MTMELSGSVAEHVALQASSHVYAAASLDLPDFQENILQTQIGFRVVRDQQTRFFKVGFSRRNIWYHN